MKNETMTRGKAFERPKQIFRDDREIAQWAKAVIRKMDPTTPEECQEFQLACFLAASSVVGPDSGRIATTLGIPTILAAGWAENLSRNGVWQEGRVRDGDWFKEEHGNFSFVSDTLVADEFVERSVNERGIATYKLAAGREWWDKN
jgi:hypothetical protein